MVVPTGHLDVRHSSDLYFLCPLEPHSVLHGYEPPTRICGSTVPYSTLIRTTEPRALLAGRRMGIISRHECCLVCALQFLLGILGLISLAAHCGGNE